MEAQLYRDFARLEDGHWWFAGRRAVVREVLRTVLPRRPLEILDVGCGTGGMLKMLVEFGCVEGLDSSAEGLEYCRARVGPTVMLHRGELPGGLPAGRLFDVITAFDVLEHIPEPVPALRALRSALRPGGLLVCTVPAYQFLWSEHDVASHHQRRYSRPMLKEHLRAAGFEPGFSSYFNAGLFLPIAAVRLAQRLWPRKPRQGGGPQSDLSETPQLFNGLLTHLFAAERLIIPRLSLPFGVSLLSVASECAAKPSGPEPS